MVIDTSRWIMLYPDLGERWIGQQLARIEQRFIQSGRHHRPDRDALLARAARLFRAATELPSRGECVWRLSDSTEIVVPTTGGRPDSTCVAKAVSVIQSRAYLQERALELVRPLARIDGNWQLVTLDFGFAAQRACCEFLMCFAFQPEGHALSVDSPYAEVGFDLLPQVADRPLFVLTLRTLPDRT